MSARHANHIKRALRILVSVGFAAILITKRPNLSQIIPGDHPARTWTFLGLAVLVTLGGVGLAAWRWQRVLVVFDKQVPVRRLTIHALVGHCVGNVLPGTIGGDVARISRLSTDISNPEVAFASVALERLAGFVALPLLVFLGFAFDPSLLSSPGAWAAIAIALTTLVLLGVVLVVAGHPSAAGRFAEHENWLRYLGAIHTGIARLRDQPRQIVSIVGTSLVYQISVVLSVGLIANGIGLRVPDAAIIAFVPAVAMIQVLPISLNGLGVRESMLQRLFAPLGVLSGQAIGLGLLWYATVLIVSFAGIPPFAAGRRSPTTQRRQAAA